jgi:hypothetical protein
MVPPEISIAIPTQEIIRSKKTAIPNRNDFTSTKSIEYSHQTHGLTTILSQYPPPLDPATNVVSDIPGMFDLA